MAIKKIKISKLPLAETISGLYTIAVDALNRSVKVSLEFLKSAADRATDAANSAIAAAKSAGQAAEAANTSAQNAQSATKAANESASLANTASQNANSAAENASKAADLANAAAGNINSKASKAVPTSPGNFATLSGEGDLLDSQVNISAYADKYPYELEVLSKQGEKSNIYCRVYGIAENEDVSSLRIFLMRTLRNKTTGCHNENEGTRWFKYVLGWRHPVHEQVYNTMDKTTRLFPDVPQTTEFPVNRGVFLIGDVLQICIKPFARAKLSSLWYIRIGKNKVSYETKESKVLSCINKDYGLAVYKIVDGNPVRVSKIVPFDISVFIGEVPTGYEVYGNVYP